MWKGTNYGTTFATHIEGTTRRRGNAGIHAQIRPLVLHDHADHLRFLHGQQRLGMVQPDFGYFSRYSRADSMQCDVQRRQAGNQALLHLDVSAAVLLRDSRLLYRPWCLSLRRGIGHDHRHAPSVFRFLLAHARKSPLLRLADLLGQRRYGQRFSAAHRLLSVQSVQHNCRHLPERQSHRGDSAHRDAENHLSRSDIRDILPRRIQKGRLRLRRSFCGIRPQRLLHRLFMGRDVAGLSRAAAAHRLRSGEGHERQKPSALLYYARTCRHHQLLHRLYDMHIPRAVVRHAHF